MSDTDMKMAAAMQAKIDRLTAQVEQQQKVIGVLRTLVDKLEAVHADPRYAAVWTLYAVHGGHYTEPKYEQEFNDAKKALADGA